MFKAYDNDYQDPILFTARTFPAPQALDIQRCDVKAEEQANNRRLKPPLKTRPLPAGVTGL